VDEIFLNLDTIIPCGLIINELISNALKHGFPGNTRGTIWIELNCVSVEPAEENTHQVTLVIGNDGIKLQDPTNFYRAKSLGFQLVQILVKQLYGQIEIDQSRGTEFKIRFSEQA
jgi:two-component sensor histidine kinase